MARWALAVVLVLVAGCAPDAGPVESDLVQLESTLDAVESELAGD